MTQQEKLDLYFKAKEAYYNGQEIMTDFEFDTLEKELGLENKSEVGTRRNPSYTVKVNGTDISKLVNDIFGARASNSVPENVVDAFDKLAKELNF